MEKLNELLALSGLEYQIEYLPWTRALREVETNPRSFIYQILRTPERENNYYWLMPASVAERIALYSSNGLATDDVMLDIKAGEFSAACYLESAQCTMLEQIGFPKDNIVVIPSQSVTAEEKLLLQARVDFILAFPSVIQHNLTVLGEDASKVTKHISFDMPPDYLAASKQVDPNLLEAMRNAVKRLAESDPNTP
jgi:polar amino acid transport system substrate-binding protein